MNASLEPFRLEAPRVARIRRRAAALGWLLGGFLALQGENWLGRLWLLGTGYFTIDLIAVHFLAQAAKRRQEPAARELVWSLELGLLVGAGLGFVSKYWSDQESPTGSVFAVAVFGMVAGGHLGLRWWKVRYAHPVPTLDPLPEPGEVEWRRFEAPGSHLSFEVPSVWHHQVRRLQRERSIDWRLGRRVLSLEYGPTDDPVVARPPSPYHVVRGRVFDGIPAVEAAQLIGRLPSQKLALCHGGQEFIWTFPLSPGQASHPLWQHIMGSIRLDPGSAGPAAGQPRPRPPAPPRVSGPIMDPGSPSVKVWRYGAFLAVAMFIFAGLGPRPVEPSAAQVIGVLVLCGIHYLLHFLIDVLSVTQTFFPRPARWLAVIQPVAIPSAVILSVVILSAVILSAVILASPVPLVPTVLIEAGLGLIAGTAPVLLLSWRWAARYRRPERRGLEPGLVVTAVIAAVLAVGIALALGGLGPPALWSAGAAFTTVSLLNVPLTAACWRRSQSAAPRVPADEGPDAEIEGILGLWRDGRLTEVRRRLEEVLKAAAGHSLRDRDILAYRLLARVHGRLGQWKQAAQVLRRGVGRLQDRLDPTSWQARLRCEIAGYEVAAGRIEDAVREAQQAQFELEKRDHAEMTRADMTRADMTHAYLARAYVALARVMVSPIHPRPQYPQAARVLLKVLDLLAAEDPETRSAASEAHLELGLLRMRMGGDQHHTAAALRHLDAALEAGRAGGLDEIWLAMIRGHRARAVARQDLDAAIPQLAEALQVVERVRSEGLAESSLRESLLASFYSVYQEMVDLCVASGEAGNLRQALELVERSRSRNLLELIRGSIRVSRSAAHKDRYMALLRRHDDVARQWSRAARPGFAAARPVSYQQQALRRELDGIAESVAAARSAAARQVATPLKWPRIRALARDSAAELWEFFVTSRALYVFVAGPADDAPEVYIYPELAEATLDQELETRWFQPYRRRKREKTPAAEQVWADAMDDTLGWLGTELFTRPDARGASLGERLEGLTRLTLLPHGLLHALPFHAFHNGEPIGPRRTYHLDDVDEVWYAPSASILSGCLEQEGLEQEGLEQEGPKQDSNRFLGVEYFKDDDSRRDSEIDRVRGLFGESVVLTGGDATREATLDNMTQAEVLLCACHGGFHEQRPIESALELADKGRLTLRDILVAGQDALPSLVALSACETGQIRRDRTDEYVGLPSAFLVGGSRCVVSSLWAVAGKAASFVMRRAFQHMTEQAMPCARAFTLAQRELRGQSVGQVEESLRDLGAVPPLTVPPLTVPPLTVPPLTVISPAHPKHWAAFCVIGAGDYVLESAPRAPKKAGPAGPAENQSMSTTRT